MSEKENIKAPEALPDEVLDAVAGGFSGAAAAVDGVLTCTCGTAINVGSARRVRCPQCGLQWVLLMGVSGWVAP